MNSYSIGSLAEKIVAVTIHLDGTVTPRVRHRSSSGRIVDRSLQSVAHDRFRRATNFVARVADGDSGVVSLEPTTWYYSYTMTAISLGSREPFCDHEVDFMSADDVPFVGANEVRFHLENGKLTWESENVSGEAVINETYPELNIVLRLPPGADGEIEIGAPVSDRVGEPVSRLLSAA